MFIVMFDKQQRKAIIKGFSENDEIEFVADHYLDERGTVVNEYHFGIQKHSRVICVKCASFEELKNIKTMIMVAIKSGARICDLGEVESCN